jgi:DNA primase
MNEVEEIKRKIDIVDFMSQYIVMHKAGANYKALCPFHNEKTPSLMISPEKQIFKCFGCNEGGDVFEFIMKMEGLEFVEALKMLADRTGVVLTNTKNKEEYQKEKDTKSRLYKINQLAAQVFHKILLESKSGELARTYLKNRNLSAKTIDNFMIGFAPDKPMLLEFLKKRGFKELELRLAGNPERFRNRIMFPITDVMGNAIGFTGRVLNSGIEPKYLNTPETTIFHKSRILYGLDKAKAEIKLQKTSIIVEGQMDVVLSHQAGVENVVATSGTALTADHLQILSRYSNNINFAFDADSAGSQAQKKAIILALESDMNANIIKFPEGIKDPGELVEKDPNAWQEVVKKNIPVIDWLINRSLEKYQKELSGQNKKEIAKEILPIIKIVPDKIEQEHYVKILSKKISISERPIIEALNKIQVKPLANNSQKPTKSNLSLEETLVGLLLVYPKYIKLIAVDLNYTDFQKDTLSQQVYKSLQMCYTADSCDKEYCTGKSCKNFLKKHFASNLLDEIKFLILETETICADSGDTDARKEILDLAKRIKEGKKENIKENFAKLIQEAEEKGDRENVKKLLMDFQKTIK